jgi:restriction system protein
MSRRRRHSTSSAFSKWFLLILIVAAALYFIITWLLAHPDILGIVVLSPVIALVIWVALKLRARQRRQLQWKTFGELLSLTPREFELAVADLLRDLRYRDIEHVGKAGDLAADLRCRDRSGNSVVVQCKRYAPGVRVGSKDIQAFIGMVAVHHQADRGIFVTTSTFTQPAMDLADQHDIQLIDGGELSRLAAGLELQE